MGRIVGRIGFALFDGIKDAAELQKLARTLPKDELEARRDGKFVSVNGLVYGEFDESVHVIDPFEVPAAINSKLRGCDVVTPSAGKRAKACAAASRDASSPQYMVTFSAPS